MAHTPRTSPTPPSPASSKRSAKETPKNFSLAEATKALPYVRRVVTDVVIAYKKATALEAQVTDLPNGKARTAMQNELHNTIDRLESLNKELRVVGVELKDPSTGLIDFPGTHQNHTVYLCWKLGEDTISHFHETDTGFAGRQPIDKLEETPPK
jgi:hypothetical protein